MEWILKRTIQYNLSHDVKCILQPIGKEDIDVIDNGFMLNRRNGTRINENANNSNLRLVKYSSQSTPI